jgi:transcriptional regulator
MYLPSQFEESRTEVLHQLVREHPFGTLVTMTPDGLNANHLPFEIDCTSAPFGILHAHVARANPVWRNFDQDLDALVIFQGPQAYISPSWYPTKQEAGKVVPTYNYVVVHAYGRMRVMDDATWMRALLERLSATHESSQPQPWTMEDAPPDYIEKMLAAVVGIEIEITRLVGKWKVSQNQPQVNRVGVAQGLRDIGSENAIAMADEVARRG